MSETVKRRSLVFYEKHKNYTLNIQDFDLNACYTTQEVVVKIHYAALNPVDYVMYRYASSCITKKSQAKPFGRDFAGEVVKVGDAIPQRQFAVGDIVVGYIPHSFGATGTMTDYLVFNPNSQKAISKINPSRILLSPETASWPLVFGTSFQAFTKYSLKQEIDWKNTNNKRILIIGASTATGIAAVQIAKNYLGASVVDGICSLQSFQRNKQFGFDSLFDYTSGHVTQDVLNHVEVTGFKYDIVYDCCGNSYFFKNISEILKPKTEKSYYVTIAGDKKMDYRNPSFPSVMGILKKLCARSYKYHYLVLSADKKWIDVGLSMIQQGSLQTPVDSVFKPEDYKKAFERLISNKAKGKIVIDFSSI